MRNRKAHILLVDDEVDFLRVYRLDLADEGYVVSCAEEGTEALEKLQKESYDVLIADLIMPGMDGIELMRKAKEICPDIEVIILTGQGGIESAVRAMKKGAYTYLSKPFNAEDMLIEIQRIEALQHLRRENQRLKDHLEEHYRFGGIIGKDEKMLEIYRIIQRIAVAPSSVLIRGESGTGKELIAQAIHRNSLRSEGPFISVNCGALPETLLESELFGYERGAFTGAVGPKKGRFERADGGTLLLDEIGDMSLNLQIKLLRVLQEGEFERLGGTQRMQVDVRLISSTNKDLQDEIRRGQFREDLFYRINVIPVYVPPLRERKGDIPLLAMHFLEKYRRQMGRDISGITPEALEVMQAYSWPGNVRELGNTIERAVVMSRRPQLDVEDLPDSIRGGKLAGPMESLVEEGMGLRDIKYRFEKEFLEDILRKHRGNITHTAESIQIPRRNLQKKIKQYNIDVVRLRA